MLKENENLLDLKFERQKIIYSKSRKIIYEALYELFFSILESPIENILFEIITFLLSYFQILMFIFNQTVSKKYYNFIYYNIVFTNLEQRFYHKKNF